MKIFFGVVAVYLTAVMLARAEELPFTLQGTSNLGEPCSVTVEKVSYYEGWENTWTGLRLQLRTSLQLPGAASLEVHQSPTPAVLFGQNEAARELISVHFERESLDPSEIRYVIYQRPGLRGSVQTRCVFR